MWATKIWYSWEKDPSTVTNLSAPIHENPMNTRRGPPRAPSYKVVITPANPMKSHGCNWIYLGINPLIVVTGPHLVAPMMTYASGLWTDNISGISKSPMVEGSFWIMNKKTLTFHWMLAVLNKDSLIIFLNGYVEKNPTFTGLFVIPKKTLQKTTGVFFFTAQTGVLR